MKRKKDRSQKKKPDPNPREEPVELEELESPENAPGVLEDALQSDEAASTSNLLHGLMDSYARTPLPLAILNSDLAFLYRNGLFLALMSDFHYPEAPGFLEAFRKAVPGAMARRIKEALAREEWGYHWSGVMTHKTREAATLLTKVQISPFFRVGAPSSRPVAYSVQFDDVTEERRRSLKDMFSSLLQASLIKDNDTGNHVVRVNHYSRVIAEYIYKDPRWPEVDKDFIEDIGFLAAMHDVGKIGTPDDILNKNGPLTEFEWSVMKQHTINGAYILSSYPNPMAREIANSHHEWWDGSGYPFNLEGNAIPLAARIVTIADVYDALRMRRSYKPAFDHATGGALRPGPPGYIPPEARGVRPYLQRQRGQFRRGRGSGPAGRGDADDRFVEPGKGQAGLEGLPEGPSALVLAAFEILPDALNLVVRFQFRVRLRGEDPRLDAALSQGCHQEGYHAPSLVFGTDGHQVHVYGLGFPQGRK